MSILHSELPTHVSSLAQVIAGTAVPADRVAFQNQHWDIDPTLTFLNHGSYGACPRAVLAAQSRYRARMEHDAVRFYKVDLEHLIDRVRTVIAGLVVCDPACLAPMPNATVAICTVLHNAVRRGLLGPGDEVLITDHEYMSGVNELNRLSSAYGFSIVAAKIPFPIRSKSEVYDAVMACVSDRTKLAMISHITSATSLIFPVERLVPKLLERGIEVLVDGAHAPGQVEINIQALNPTYYVGSGHKWLSAPKGTGFLYVHPALHQGFRPVSLSSRAHKIRPERALFLRDFDYVGTDDYTGILAMADAIQYMGALLPGGWPELIRRNHATALKARDIVCRALRCQPPAPDDMIGCMATVLLPEAAEELQSRPTIYDDPLQDNLVAKHGIVVPIWRLAATNARVLRVSAQLYNSLDQYEHLARALLEELILERAFRIAA